MAIANKAFFNKETNRLHLGIRDGEKIADINYTNSNITISVDSIGALEIILPVPEEWNYLINILPNKYEIEENNIYRTCYDKCTDILMIGVQFKNRTHTTEPIKNIIVDFSSEYPIQLEILDIPNIYKEILFYFPEE